MKTFLRQVVFLSDFLAAVSRPLPSADRLRGFQGCRGFAEGISASEPLYSEKLGLALPSPRMIKVAQAPLLITADRQSCRPGAASNVSLGDSLTLSISEMQDASKL
ncbi:hypothetical protein PAL_GLEAN10011064 [Pteropus alecto]|uniref:Uncharacterized protein n=1 Tax=Pteropus alecto TaxID=9402 RepID=L5KX95_PTEAL|nr:hypothetical protein PAL_GLEAN10011064 [Pteropus alecto]